jgi:NADH-quinone oxidoreductase subunit J
MSVTTGLFYLFSAILLAAAFRVITTRNPVHAVLCLVLTFFQASMIWMLLKAEFLSLTLVLVYVGAVMVLFLFVVMMLDVNMEEMRKGFWKHFPLAAILGILIVVEMSAVLLGGFHVADGVNAGLATTGVEAELSNSKQLGKLLYTQYFYPLEVATAILLVGMIAAIALTLRQRKDSKAIDPAAQVRVRAKDRMTVVKLVATQPALPVEAVEAPSGESKA